MLTNLGESDYDALQTQFTYRGNPKILASLSYTLAKAITPASLMATVGPNQIVRAPEEERDRGVDQRQP